MLNGRFGKILNIERKKKMENNYRFISKKSPNVKRAYDNMREIIKQVHRNLQEFTFRDEMVGSYSRNMITCDIKSNIGYDFDVNIYPNNENKDFSAKEIKLLFKQELDKIAPKYGYDYAEDSTRVLTIKIKDRENSRILHSVDFAFVRNNKDNKYQEYIHFNKKHKNYSWNKRTASFYMLPEKMEWLKRNNLWEEMKKIYIYKKNCNDNPNKHSRSLYAEAVNETYNTYYNHYMSDFLSIKSLHYSNYINRL